MVFGEPELTRPAGAGPAAEAELNALFGGGGFGALDTTPDLDHDLDCGGGGGADEGSLGFLWPGPTAAPAPVLGVFHGFGGGGGGGGDARINGVCRGFGAQTAFPGLGGPPPPAANPFVGGAPAAPMAVDQPAVGWHDNSGTAGAADMLDLAVGMLDLPSPDLFWECDADADADDGVALAACGFDAGLQAALLESLEAESAAAELELDHALTASRTPPPPAPAAPAVRPASAPASRQRHLETSGPRQTELDARLLKLIPAEQMLHQSKEQWKQTLAAHAPAMSPAELARLKQLRRREKQKAYNKALRQSKKSSAAG